MKTRHLCAPCPTPSSTRHRPQTHLPHLLQSLRLQVTAPIHDHPLSVTVLLNYPTGYETHRIVDDYENMHFTDDDQITELEDRVEFLTYHQSITASTHDSAESIATSPEADLDDEQLRTLVASPLYLQERGASAGRSQVYHSERENLMSSSSQDPTSGGTGKLVAVFSSQSMLNLDTFPDEDQFSLKHQQFFGSSEPFFRFSNPANVTNSLFDGNRDHLLAEARLELMKQEYKVESLDTCINELQQQSYAQRLELEDAHFGCAESRREQVRMREELVMKEKALRDTQIRSLHEM